MIITEHNAILERIQADKTTIALSVENVRMIDNILERDWNVTFPRKGANSWSDLLPPGADTLAVERYREAYDAVEDALVWDNTSALARSEPALYDAMAHPAILGPVTSQRRHLIIDGISIGIGLAKALKLERIIDIGCHAGIVTNLISEELECRVLGIDPSSKAIEYARSRARGGVAFAAASFPFHCSEQFDLAMVIDALPEDDAEVTRFLGGLGRILVPGGIAIIVSGYWGSAQPADVRRRLQEAGFGFGYGDVVGGLGGVPLSFEAEDVLVVLKGGRREYPANFQTLMESEWDQFRRYANATDTPPREKTQAFERAWRKLI